MAYNRYPFMASTPLYLGCFALCSALWLASPRAQADAKAEAAASFDAGVNAYKAGDFRAAARHFIAADDARPNASALANALASARNAGDWPMLANVATRTLARDGVPDEVASVARQAMADATPHVAELIVRCDDAPCQVLVDGEERPAFARFVAPGTHRVESQRPGIAPMELACGAGASCTAQLVQPVVATAPARAPAPEPEVAEPSPAPSAPPGDVSARPSGFRRHLPLAAFVGASAATVTLAALGIWQGVEALHERDQYPDPARYDRARVQDLARRSDFLIAGSVVAGGVALVSGLWWVDWKSYGRSNLSVSARGDALLTHRLSF